MQIDKVTETRCYSVFGDMRHMSPLQATYEHVFIYIIHTIYIQRRNNYRHSRITHLRNEWLASCVNGRRRINPRGAQGVEKLTHLLMLHKHEVVYVTSFETKLATTKKKIRRSNCVTVDDNFIGLTLGVRTGFHCVFLATLLLLMFAIHSPFKCLQIIQLKTQVILYLFFEIRCIIFFVHI